MAVDYLEITFRSYLILEVLRGARVLRVFLRNTRRLVIFFYQLLQESFLLKKHKNITSFEPEISLFWDVVSQRLVLL